MNDVETTEIDTKQNAPEIWNYPDIHTEDAINLTDEVLPLPEQIEKSPDKSLGNSELDDQNHLSHAKELELQQKINYIDTLSQQVQLQFEQINSNFVSDTVGLIKKITKKILLKELSVDESALKIILDEATPLIATKGKACTIYVASDDFTFVKDYAQNLEHTLIKVDEALDQGDFRIQTEFNELESILEQRLSELFEI